MTAVLTVESFPGADRIPLRYAVIAPSRETLPSGPPILFIPGLGGSVKNALSFLKPFAGQVGPVFGLDARGFGLNEAVVPKLNPTSYLQDFRALLAHLNQTHPGVFSEQKPVVFGLSLGAVFTVLHLSQSPLDFQAAVLIAPAFRPHPDRFTPGFRARTYMRFLTQGLGAKTILPYGVTQITQNPDFHNDPNFRDPFCMPTFYLAWVDYYCRQAFRKSRQLALPVAVLLPEQDQICDPDTMKAAFEQMQTGTKQLFLYNRLFHDICMEPERLQQPVREDVMAWLQEVTGRVSLPTSV